MPSRRRPGASSDLEEVRPNLFIVYNPAAGPALRGEGEREGDRFRLTTWRREGLIARLRARGFAVRTLADLIAELPEPPPAPLGPPAPVALPKGEQLSRFVADPPGWAPITPGEAGPEALSLPTGLVLRRRRGRGPARYARLLGRAGLAPLGEDEALLAGYAQAAPGAPPLALAAAPGGWLLPAVPLPSAHRSVLSRLAERAPAGWLIADAEIPLVAALLGRLGVRVEAPGREG